jgi:enoyl-[acyl-carrier-protein] reductase (NADH)
MHREGAELAFTYQNEKLRDARRRSWRRVETGLEAHPADATSPSDAQIDAVFAAG